MGRFLSVLGKTVLGLLVLGALIWVFAPIERIDRRPAFDPETIGPDIEAYLTRTESRFPDIRDGVAKRIVWAGEPGEQTDIAVLYIHGFSATSEEIRPVPDLVAASLEANLYFTRLTGHGRTGNAMAEAQAEDWIADMAETMAIGRRIGDRLLVIGTSTGATLAALAANDPALSRDMAGVVLISPNFGLRSRSAKILDMPFARVWGPILAGDRRSFAPLNDRHAAFWTTEYPTAALFPMATLVREALIQDYGDATMPALFIYAPEDQVIDPTVIPSIIEDWGGPVREELRVMGPGDDPNSHVIAGDILSPGQTETTVQMILDWAQVLE